MPKRRKLTDDELAQQMEDLLLNVPGTHYVTRNDHGQLRAGTPCRIWRPNHGRTLQVLISAETMKGLDFLIGKIYKRNNNWNHTAYVGSGWYLEGIEDKDSRQEMHDTDIAYKKRNGYIRGVPKNPVVRPF